MRSPEEEDRMEEDSIKGIEMTGTTGSSKGDRSPPSPIAGEALDGTGCVNLEEGLENDMYFVMQRLFAEDDMFERIKDPLPRSSGSISPTFPWYFTIILTIFFLN